MKKILSIALVALLATSAVFAGFTGTAKINLGANFETGVWGFTNSTELGKLDFTWQSGAGENAGEGAIYAGIKGSFSIKSSNAKAAMWKNADVALKLSGSISEAYITDGNWNVSILGAVGAPDFANSAAIDGNNNKVSYKSAAAAAPGFKVTTANGYTAAFGAAGNWKTDVIDWSAYVATPSYDLAEGLTANFAAAASEKTEIAVSAKVAYAGDVSANAAIDFGYSTSAKAFDFDVAAQVKVAPVTVDAYYWYSKKNLAVKAAATIEAIDITAMAKDILGDKDLSLEVGYDVNDALSVSADGSFTVADKSWSAGAGAEYAAADYTAKANATYESKNALKVSASIESATVVPGATLKLAYAADDVLNKKYGSVNASCTIKF